MNGLIAARYYVTRDARKVIWLVGKRDGSTNTSTPRDHKGCNHDDMHVTMQGSSQNKTTHGLRPEICVPVIAIGLHGGGESWWGGELQTLAGNGESSGQRELPLPCWFCGKARTMTDLSKEGLGNTGLVSTHQWQKCRVALSPVAEMSHGVVTFLGG